MIKQISLFLKNLLQIFDNKLAKWSLYSLYSVILVVFFLYYLFPCDDIKFYITEYVKKANPDLNIQIDQVKPVFPLGISLENPVFVYKSKPTFNFDRVKISPSILSFFWGQRLNFDFKCISKNHNIIKGHADIGKNNTMSDLFVTLLLSGLELKGIDYIKDIFNREISGIVSGSVTVLSNEKSDIIVNADLNILDCVVELSTPVLSKLEFEQVNAAFDWSKTMVELKHVSVTGDTVSGNFNGNISLREPIGKSRLNIRGTIKPSAKFLSSLSKILSGNLLSRFGLAKKGIPVGFRGTIDNPKFSLK